MYPLVAAAAQDQAVHVRTIPILRGRKRSGRYHVVGRAPGGYVLWEVAVEIGLVGAVLFLVLRPELVPTSVVDRWTPRPSLGP